MEIFTLRIVVIIEFKFDSNGNFIRKIGSRGQGVGQFWSPFGIDVDNENNIIVSDHGNHQIHLFSSNGNFIRKIGSQGNSDSQFLNPRGLAINSKSHVIIAEYSNHRIQIFG